MATQTIERPVQRPAADLEALFPGRYLSVTSFKRDGTGVATPVWFVSDGRRLFALTDLHSAKVRRIAAIRVSWSRRAGRTASFAGTGPGARGGADGHPDLERVQKLLIERYKLSYRLVMLIYRLGRRSAAGPASPTAPHSRSRSAARPVRDDGSHTPPHGDALLVHGGGELR